MRLKKSVEKVNVVVRDVASNKSKTITVYETSLEKMVDSIIKMVEKSGND